MYSTINFVDEDYVSNISVKDLNCLTDFAGDLFVGVKSALEPPTFLGGAEKELGTTVPQIFSTNLLNF